MFGACARLAWWRSETSPSRTLGSRHRARKSKFGCYHSKVSKYMNRTPYLRIFVLPKIFYVSHDQLDRRGLICGDPQHGRCYAPVTPLILTLHGHTRSSRYLEALIFSDDGEVRQAAVSTNIAAPVTPSNQGSSIVQRPLRNDVVNENELQYLYRVFFSVRTSCPVLVPTRKHRIRPTQPQLDQFCSVSSHQPPFRLSILGRHLAFALPSRQIKTTAAGAKPAGTRLSVPHPIVSRRLLSSPALRPTLLLRRRLLLL